ncbi:MAG: M28 family peptidase [Bacteroidales bacterium]|nr:M28 family peptidase [Bacteroidales bacterium]
MKILGYVLIASSVLFSSCIYQYNTEINNEDLSSLINFLASDSLKGRLPGTAEDAVLLDFISSEFDAYGIEAPDSGFIQSFDLITGVEISDKNFLKFGETSYIQKEDFYPAAYSASGTFSAELMFCGYGLEINTDEFTRNDFQNLNIDGKWAVILRGIPESEINLDKYNNDRDKVMLAADKGALGVLLVSGENYDSEDKLNLEPEHIPAVSIPVIQIKREVIKDMFSDNLDLKSLEVDLNSKVLNKVIISNEKLDAFLEINKLNTPTANVIGILPGTDPVKSKEWIIIGAHHDHLGMGGRRNSSRMPDTIAVHNGADDNASGIASVIELASYFSSKDLTLERSLLFVTFGAEEKGLVGSKYFVENSPVPIENILAMVNIDMLGRMSPDSILQIGGIGTSAEAKEMVEEINENYHFKLKLSEAGYGPSDHASFYAKDIPVFFFSTGAHQDYHTPFDDIDSLNIEGLRNSSEFISDLVLELDKIDSLSFQEAGSKAGGRAYTGSVTLGIMPDVSGSDDGGLTILAVTKGKPAYNSGMKKGDTIIAIDGNEIGNIYDYMYRLKTYKKGDVIIVTILRNQDEIDLLVQL